MITGINLTDELHNLQARKSTLEHAIRIAASLEKLNHGLKAVILMGKPTSSISQKSIRNIEELDEKTRILPNAQLKEILSRLENTVQDKLSLIIRISEKEENTEAESVDEEIDNLSHADIDEILKEYLKSAQTAVALKIMLRARGEITRPTRIELPAEDIRKKLNEIDVREKKCRTKVKKEMIILLQDTDKMLVRDDLPDNLREMISATQKGLRLNLDHIESGRSIDSMPVTIENVEMASDEVKPVIRKKHRLKKSHVNQYASETVKKSRQPGFFYKLWRWMTTPPSVGWDDVEEELRRKKDK